MLVIMFGALYRTGEVGHELDTGALTDSRENARRRFDLVRAELSQLPPSDWTHADTNGTMRAARYVAECTAPDDYLLIGAYAPEIPVFAHRRFAAGQPIVSLSFYTSDADQQRALARWRQQSVPVVLTTDKGYNDEFRGDYPVLAAYLESHYHVAGTIPTDEDHRHLRVYVENNRPSRRTDAVLGLPCFR
jgi:hypothetical protein